MSVRCEEKYFLDDPLSYPTSMMGSELSLSYHSNFVNLDMKQQTLTHAYTHPHTHTHTHTLTHM